MKHLTHCPHCHKALPTPNDKHLEIYLRWANGEKQKDMAAELGVGAPRIWGIIQQQDEIWGFLQPLKKLRREVESGDSFTEKRFFAMLCGPDTETMLRTRKVLARG